MKPVELLAELMRRSGDNPNSLASKLKKKTTQPQIYKFLEGISKEPRRSTLQPVADFYSVDIEAFYSEKACLEAWDSLQRKDGNVVEIGNFRGKNKPDELVIPEFNTGGSMGSGLLLRDQPGVIRGWSVNQEWVSKNVKSHTGTANLCIVTGFGDSMKGMYNPGDPLLVDRGVTNVEYDAVYFFRVESEGFIKRLQRIPGEGLRVLSENKKYESWTIKPDMDFEVLGRVLKAWQGEEF